MITLTAIDKFSILHDTFGFKTFRPQQEEIIDELIDGKDCLVIMPTGGGKSMCFQLPALIREGVAIVISPLIALMNDQVAALNQLGIAAEAVHSNHSNEKLRSIIDRLERNEIKLLYVSPERINNTSFQSFLSKLNINLIAIDEAHCVSIWGNDFRPDYASLSFLKKSFPQVPLIALTATADKVTQEDIIKQLGLDTKKTYLSSFERKNITAKARPSHNRKKQIIDFINLNKGHSGIVYCLSRKSCEKMSSDLNSAGIPSVYYHAGMEARERSDVQRRFQEDETQVVCATIAFGMGIDKSNIRWVIHFNMPKNLESYYQEIGRSGRDGSEAQALMFFSWGDIIQLRRFIDGSDASAQFKAVQHAKLDRMWEYATTTDCRTNIVLNYFGEYRSEKCGHCDNCLAPAKKFDGTIIVQKAISGVIRAKEKLNINLLIDVLRGSYRQEVKDGNFQLLKTFGVGRDLSFQDWKHYITQIIDKGLLRIDYSDGLKLRSTPLSLSSIKSGIPIMLSRYVEPDQEQIKIKYKKKTGTQLIEEELVEEMKAWRLKIAREKQVPAYVILTDRSIEQIVIEKPTNLYELKEVEGIGDKRLEEYGNEILTKIQDYLRTQDHKKNLKGRTYLETLQLYKEGMTPSEIAAKRELNEVTIFSHLAKLYEDGENIEIYNFITEEEVAAVRIAYEKTNGSDSLGLLTENMLKPIAFYKIKLAIGIFRRPK